MLYKAQERFIQVRDGKRIGVEFTPGQRPEPIVLLNGSLFNLKQWDLLIKCGFRPHLRGEYSILRYDYSGTGRSVGVPSGNPVKWDLFHLAHELKDLLDAEGISKVHLFGLSKGTIVAQVFASQYPDRVVSIGGYGWFHLAYSRMAAIAKFFGERLKHFDRLGEKDPNPLSMSEFKAIWQDVYTYVLTQTKSQVPWWFIGPVQAVIRHRAYSLLEPTPTRVMYDWFSYAVKMMPEAHKLFSHEYEKFLHIPTLIQHSKFDGTLPFAMAEELHARLPHSKLIAYGKGYNHISITLRARQAEAVVKDYGEFLQGHAQ